MRIALFFMAFTLGAGLAPGLDAADASSRRDRQQTAGALQVQPVRWNGETPVATHPTAPTSGWTPGAGELVLATLAAGTLGAGLFVRRRTLVPVRV